MDPHGADGWTSLAADSHASPTAPLANVWERTTNATCGPKCCASYAKLPRPTLWAKTFAASLIGAEAWSSRRCALTWKLKGTTYGRAYFLLQASAHPTDGIEFGLLLTPTAVQTCEHPDNMQARAQAKGYRNGTKYGSLTSQVTYGMLPTPRVQSANGPGMHGQGGMDLQTTVVMGMLPTPTAGEAYHGGKTYNPNSQMGRGLSAMAGSSMLPTPTASDSKNASLPPSQANRDSVPGMVVRMLPTPNAMDWNTARSPEALQAAKEQHGSALQDTLRQRAGQGSQLSPRFVAEMMGFPVNWTELPFQSGATNQSRPTATQ